MKAHPNPFRPGAGHMPPFLAGREPELVEFRRILGQDPILENVVLTGLRGVGKTVLLETFRPDAIAAGWYWAGADLSESTSVSEETLAIRLMTDLSVVTSGIVVAEEESRTVGFQASSSTERVTLGFDTLRQLYNETPGLAQDKLKRVLGIVWGFLEPRSCRGVVFAYDEAQNLADNARREQYPLSLLLDLFQSIQRRGIPFMLVLTGLPTLFPKLVEARTFAERMFRVMFLDRLSEHASHEAIRRPTEMPESPVTFSDAAIRDIHAQSGGYPYFIQFICREVFDAWLRSPADDVETLDLTLVQITRKLDSDFFAGRWARATDRQRDLLRVIAQLADPDTEFSLQELVEKSKHLPGKPFSSSHANQMLATLGEAGLVYKNRHGKYCFAVPLLGRFILRQMNAD